MKQTQQRKQSPSKLTNDLPNYKNTTRRFDARKDKLQVSTDSSTSYSKIKSMNIIKNTVSSSICPGNNAVFNDREKISDLKPLKSSMKKNSRVDLHPTVNLSTATYSSAIKIARNAESLDLGEPNGVSNQKLCSYRYCSLHGQKRNEASMPARKSFLSAKRQSVKAPNSMNQKEQSSKRKLLMIMGDHDEANLLQESYSVTSFEDYVDNHSEISTEQNEFFDEHIQYIEEERQEETHSKTEEGKAGSVDLELADGLYQHSQSHSLQFFDDFHGQTKESIREDKGCNFNTLSTSNHAGSDSKLSPLVDTNILPEADDGKIDLEIKQSTTFSYSYAEESEKSANVSLQSGVELSNDPNEVLEADLGNLEVHSEEDHDKKAKVENIGYCESFKHRTIYESQQGMLTNYDKNGDISDGLANGKKNVKNFASFNSKSLIAELTNKPTEKYSAMRKLTAENQETARVNNPRPPRFLPLKPEPKAEVVSLKHQAVEERKRAEEWMIDYALQKTLATMAPARKRKVALLVAAFESVIQQEKRSTAQ